MYRSLPLLLLLPTLACHPWDLPQDGWAELSAPTWDPAVVAATDGVYVRLPAANQLVRVGYDGVTTPVDLNGATPDALELAPDGATLLVRASWPICADSDPKITRVSECDEEDLDTGYEISLVRDAVVQGTLTDVPPQFNRVAYNADGTLGVAYLDFGASGGVDIDLVLNLTQVTFFELGSSVAAHSVTVGFAAESVLFTPGAPRAVVLSRSQVAVVDLTSWQVTVTYPLTLDPDQAVVPTDVVLTPDGRYALVSVDGQSDLYVLDLEQESIDLVELDGSPSDLYVDEANDRTVLVYAGRPQVDVLDHDYFELQTYELDEPANQIQSADGHVVLYNSSGYHDVILFDVATEEMVEYRAENPVMDLWVTADRSYAVATLDRESSGSGGVSGFYDQYYGLDIFNLTVEENPIALALEDRPVGVALAEDGGENHALVLMDNVDTILNIDLFDGSNAPIELGVAPIGILASPDGRFVVTQDNPEGLLSFLDAATSELSSVTGFALTGLLADDTLPRRSVE